jgi:hypothetical protein
MHHPDMHEHRSLVEETVRSPLEIRISDADINCRLYFGVGPRSGTITVVVADISVGLVKTAHLVKAAKGALEWSRPTQ